MISDDYGFKSQSGFQLGSSPGTWVQVPSDWCSFMLMKKRILFKQEASVPGRSSLTENRKGYSLMWGEGLGAGKVW